MQRDYTKNQLIQYSSEAFDVIDWAVDGKIWRTNQRIFELVNQKGNSNPFLRNPLWFTDILIRRIYFGWLSAITWWILLSGENEKYEESGSEPIIIDDLHVSGSDIYAAIFTERIFYLLFLTGINYTEAKEEFFRVFDKRLGQLEKIALQKWIFENSLFYKRVDIPPEKHQEVPLLVTPDTFR